MIDPDRIITDILEESLRVKRGAISENSGRLRRGAEMIAAVMAAGRKVLIFGNGGSAADAQHLAAEFVNRFRLERPPLAALALTTDSSILTAVGNDYRFEDVFAKQINALGAEGDLAWAISTSGNSPNVVAALLAARRRGLATIGMTGRGGRLAEAADLLLTVDSAVTARIQETHITMGHILCELVDRILFPEAFAHET
ncbi:MAG: D-sedoheptulose 7-phosphate isomerase [Desulfobacterales bacterium]|jgi:D-sedoheptulose 7-phosphate isomerase|nr:D-sedoheptulose 7-phosphate isomerase [Desulfobacterales bacterium]